MVRLSERIEATAAADRDPHPFSVGEIRIDEVMHAIIIAQEH
jgi:hypothetical protein